MWTQTHLDVCKMSYCQRVRNVTTTKMVRLGKWGRTEEWQSSNERAREIHCTISMIIGFRCAKAVRDCNARIGTGGRRTSKSEKKRIKIYNMNRTQCLRDVSDFEIWWKKGLKCWNYKKKREKKDVAEEEEAEENERRQSDKRNVVWRTSQERNETAEVKKKIGKTGKNVEKSLKKKNRVARHPLDRLAFHGCHCRCLRSTDGALVDSEAIIKLI